MSDAIDLAPVTVIGLGPMGQAMAATLLKAGHPVTVWNRTPSRAETLVASGATLAPTPADAVAASRLTILSLTDYQAMYDILDGSTDALTGTTIVNLSSDTPDVTRNAAAWAAQRRAPDLSTVVMMGATADHILNTSTANGVDTELPHAIKSHYDRAIADGHGADNWTAIYEVIKPQT